MTNPCPLTLIEWEDSAQPIPNWAYLSEFEPTPAIRCLSVGWLIHDGRDVKVIAPNMGRIDEGNSVQVSGVIRIPARCVVRLVELDEPEIAISASSAPDPSFHPEKGRSRQAF